MGFSALWNWKSPSHGLHLGHLSFSLNLLTTMRHGSPGWARLIYIWSEQNALCLLLSGIQNGLKEVVKVEFYALPLFPHDYLFSNTNNASGGCFQSSPSTSPLTQFLLIPTPSHFFSGLFTMKRILFVEAYHPEVFSHPFKHDSS